MTRNGKQFEEAMPSGEGEAGRAASPGSKQYISQANGKLPSISAILVVRNELSLVSPRRRHKLRAAKKCQGWGKAREGMKAAL